MNIHLKQLIDLSLVDKEIDAYEPRIAQINAEHDAMIEQQDEIAAEIDAINEEIKDGQLKRSKNDLHLAELSAKLEENSKKSIQIKTEREMKSLQLEEEIAKEQITFANEEIERLEKMIDIKKESIETLSTQMSKLSKQLVEVKEAMQSELKIINTEREKVYANKHLLVGKMNQKSLSFYEKIRRWAKNSTAVAIRKQACYGCHIKISDKVYSEVIKGDEIVTCPHCGRILYIEPEVSGDEATQ